ncbi:hypothetical protein [Paracoccus sp. Ld10]|uniref:hypothetical protein n=1 Tax=Paracoccus sp. Ld10 TaxID=649158 RepID=UPI0038691D55
MSRLRPRTPSCGPLTGLAVAIIMIGPAGGWAQQGAEDPLGGLVISAMPLETGLPATGDGVITASLAPDPAALALPLAGFDQPQPLRPGLPRPSIVVGDMAVLLTAGPRGPYGLPHPARDAIRNRDAAMFARLLGQGAFDPDPGQEEAAIQSELARMACYSGAIDGDWGGGSVAALARYAQAGGAAEANLQPDLALFRAIIGADSVTCPPPAPVAATSAPSPSQPSQPAARQTSTPRAAPAGSGGTAPAAAPSQSPGAPRQINPGLMGTGVFR